MLQKSARTFLASVLLIACASISLAQTLMFKVGDEVEAHTYWVFAGSTNWTKAKIIAVETNGRHKGPYQVHYDGQSDSYNEWLPTDSVRPPAGQPHRVGNQTIGGNQRTTANGGALKVGDHVDIFYDEKRGKDRGTIVEVGDGKYKIRYDGCKSYRDAWEDRMSVRPAATISATDPEMRFLIGNWAMFTPSYPNTVVRGGTVYREYGMGATAPPLQIKADGSYLWYFDFGKPPVNGKWTTHAKVGEKIGKEAISRTVTDNGIIIKDPSGAEWKVYRWVMPDNQDRITAQLMCSGETMIGSRIR